MLLNIITRRKTISFKSNEYEYDAYKAHRIEKKNIYLIDRLLKKKKPVNTGGRRAPHKWYNDIYIADNYRKYWFCKSCCNIFRLKPIRKYKTLLFFKLRCMHCDSKKIDHNELLCKAIIDKKPVEELLSLCKEDDLELGFEMDSYLQYSKHLHSHSAKVFTDLTIYFS